MKETIILLSVMSDNNKSDILSLFNRNDKFSSFKALDLQELINIIESFYLVYRSTLNLPDDVSFGGEIEYQKLSRLFVNDYINKNFSNWISTNDDSIGEGGEVVSPRLFDNKNTWNELRVLCRFLKENNAKALDNTGAHMHVGAHILGGNQEKCFNFCETYVAYEKILSRFFWGESLCAREHLNLKMKSMTKKFAYIGYDISEGKVTNINLDYFFKSLNKGFVIRTNDSDLSACQKKGNTFELRAPNGTLEEIIWQNNFNTSTKLLLAIKNDKIDIDLVRYKIKNEFIDNLNDKNLFNKIYISDALEFVDMIFDNNLDKVYFLRQYFKNFETALGSKTLVKAKSFIDNSSISIKNVA